MRTKVYLEIFCSLIEAVIGGVPGTVGRRIRFSYYKKRLKYLGKNSVIDGGVRILNPEFVSIGENTWIDNYVVIIAGPPSARFRNISRRDNHSFKGLEGEVVIGNNCHIAISSVIQGHGGVQIGDNSTVASGGKVYSMTHHYANLDDPEDPTLYHFSSMVPASSQALVVSPAVMGRGTGLGLNSVLLPGGTISEGSWVGANSLVLKTVPPYSIAFGTPAKVMSARKR